MEKTFSELLAVVRPADIARALGVPYHQPVDWRRRDRIPPERWVAVAKFFADHGRSDVTVEALAAISARKAISQSSGQEAGFSEEAMQFDEPTAAPKRPGWSDVLGCLNGSVTFAAAGALEGAIAPEDWTADACDDPRTVRR